MLKQILFDNPLLIRHLRSNLRAPRAGYLTVIVVLLSSLLMFAGYKVKALDDSGPYTFFFSCQILAMCLAGTSQVAASISNSNDSGILDFHRITPLSPITTTLGFMIGGAVREHLIALLLVPFTLMCALLSHVGIVGFLTSTLVLISSTLLFHSLGLTAGLVARRGKTRNVNSGLIFLILIALACSGLVSKGLPIPGMLTAWPALAEAKAVGMPVDAVPPTFFGIQFPVFLQSLFYQIPLILFLVVAATRRMESATAMFFSKSTAVAFLVTIAALSLGGVIEHPKLDAVWLVPILAYLEFIIALLMVLAITPNQGQYQGGARRAKRIGMGRPPLWQDDSSNRAAVFVMATLAIATVQIIQTLVPALNIDARLWRVAGTATGAIAYFGFATQYFSLKHQNHGKLRLMMFLFLFWILPLFVALLLGGIMQQPDFALHVACISPLYGIGSGSWVAFLFAASMAGIFFGLLIRQEHLVWEALVFREIAKEDELADSERGNPFM